jgi:large subunit ribosomal protein L24
MIRIKRDDIVQVISGDDRGKTGRVLRFISQEKKLIIEGINMVWKHVKRSQKHPKGGRIRIEAPVDISNVMIMCQSCNKPTKIMTKYIETPEVTKKSRKKIRICKKCKGPIRPEE